MMADKDCSSGRQSSSPSKGESDNLLSSKIQPIIDGGSKKSYPPFYRRSILKRGSSRKTRRRAVLKSGECNTVKLQLSNRSYRFLQDIFTTLVDIQWRWTLLCFALAFVLSWLGFALVWYLILHNHGDFEEPHLPYYQDQSSWTPCVANMYSFTSVFLFSIETQHTIGYGSRYTTEECPEAVCLMCLQSVVGVMIQALMAGVVFAKMSRPKQRTQTILFSKNATVSMQDGELCLMFRVGDMRKSHIIAAMVKAQLIQSRFTREGECLFMHQHELTIGTDGYNNNLFFIWPLTIVHRINSASPFYHMSPMEMMSSKFEIVVTLEGTIESTGQPTQARSSYLPQEILWGQQFETMVTYSELKQHFQIDYSLFNKTRRVSTPQCSAASLTSPYSKEAILHIPHDLSQTTNYSSEIATDHHNRESKTPESIVDIPAIDEVSDELIIRQT